MVFFGLAISSEFSSQWNQALVHGFFGLRKRCSESNVHMRSLATVRYLRRGDSCGPLVLLADTMHAGKFLFAAPWFFCLLELLQKAELLPKFLVRYSIFDFSPDNNDKPLNAS